MLFAACFDPTNLTFYNQSKWCTKLAHNYNHTTTSPNPFSLRANTFSTRPAKSAPIQNPPIAVDPTRSRRLESATGISVSKMHAPWITSKAEARAHQQHYQLSKTHCSACKTCSRAHMSVQARIHVRARTHTHTHIHTHTQKHTHTHIRTHIHTRRQTHKHTRNTHRHTHTRNTHILNV
jgi:hypothetical protein